MYICVICSATTPLDDAVGPTEDGRCLCLSCLTRETGTALTVPAELQGELATIMDGSAWP